MRPSVLLLAGGAGTRIRHLHPNVPKPLIPIAGRPFIEWMIRFWRRQGAERFVVTTGHMAETAEGYFESPHSHGIVTVREPSPLGTGGAITFAAAKADLTDPFIAANADSLIAADLAFAWPLLEDDTVDGVIIGVAVKDTSRYGSLKRDAKGNLSGFYEKQPGAGVINGGIYFLKRRLLNEFPRRAPLSMEHDVFPFLIGKGSRLRVAEITGDFLDIGTPESLERAEAFVLRNMSFFTA